ncbi:MAG: hypothetical protein ACI4JY_08000 [Oscillospiraceae bacterium]
MTIECAVIAGFFVLMAVIFFRTHHKEWALATFPMILVPLTDCVLEFLVMSTFHVNVNVFAGVLTMIIAVAIAAAWIGVASQVLKNKKTSLTYVSISNFFNVALTAIIVEKMLEKSSVTTAFIM